MSQAITRQEVLQAIRSGLTPLPKTQEALIELLQWYTWLEDAAPIGDKETRRDWPFKDMAIGDVISFGKSIAMIAQRSTHTYAKSCSDKKFKTRTCKQTGKLYVRRVW